MTYVKTFAIIWVCGWAVVAGGMLAMWQLSSTLRKKVYSRLPTIPEGMIDEILGDPSFLVTTFFRWPIMVVEAVVAMRRRDEKDG